MGIVRFSCGCIDRAVRDGVHRGISQSVADVDRAGSTIDGGVAEQLGE
jgi:hypothetical protein